MAERAPQINFIQGPGYALGGENRLIGPLNQHLLLGGNPNLIPNSPGTAVAGPPAGGFFNLWTYYVLSGMTIYYEDAGAFPADGFGAGAALTTGIGLSIVDDEDVGVTNILGVTGELVNTNGEWLRFFGGEAVTIANYGAGTNEYLSVYIDFNRFFGTDLVLNPGWKIQMVLGDDMVQLVDLSAVIHGRIIFAPKGGGSFQPI